MNIRIHIHSPGLNMDAVLRPEVLPQLLEIIQNQRVPVDQLADHERRPKSMNQPRMGGRGLGKLGKHHGDTVAESVEWDPVTLPIRQKLAALNLEEMLTALSPKTFPEKILSFGGWLAARKERLHFNPGDARRLLVRLRQEPPANPGRDFRQARELGWLVLVGERQFSLSNAGWQKLSELLEEKASLELTPP